VITDEDRLEAALRITSDKQLAIRIACTRLIDVVIAGRAAYFREERFGKPVKAEQLRAAARETRRSATPGTRTRATPESQPQGATA
jgi:hypothetical protein